MRTPDGLYFAPGIRFRDLDLGSPRATAAALDARVRGWYLDPGDTLVNSAPLAAGIIFTCFIDAMAELSGSNFVDWTAANVPGMSEPDPRRLDKRLAESFYEDVRNGLVHHNRLNRGAEFSTHFNGLVDVINDVLIVNPERLARSAREAWVAFIVNLEENPDLHRSVAQRMQRTFRVDFAADVEWRTS